MIESKKDKHSRLQIEEVYKRMREVMEQNRLDEELDLSLLKQIVDDSYEVKDNEIIWRK